MKYKLLISIVLIFLMSCKATKKNYRCPAYGIPATPFKKY